MKSIIYKIRWVIDRWKIMQHPQEELYRIKQQIQYRLIDKRWYKKKPVEGGFKYKFNGTKFYTVSNLKKLIDSTCDDLENYPILNASINNLLHNTKWNFDFKNGVQGQCRFVHGIDAFDIKLGDYRYYYELGRLHWLPMLAIVGIIEKAEILTTSLKMLKEWYRQNPFMSTVAWQSANEVGIRVINLIYYRILLGLTGEMIEEDTEVLLEELIELHYKFIISHLSLYSSKGNHHTGEMAGIIAICSTYEFKDNDRILSNYFSELQSEIMRLIFKDGFDKEQSTNYLTSYINLNVTALMLAKQQGYDAKEEVWDRIRIMYVALDKFRISRAEFFHIGDTDNAELIFPYFDHNYNIYESQLNDSVILFGDKRYADYHFDLRNYLLFGDNGMETYLGSGIKDMSKMHEFMMDSGYFIIRNKRINLLFDFGQIGLMPQMCHGHADMLNVLLYANGKPVLVDCGCYQYNAFHKKYRDYFHGSSSHNVITINGRDQAQLGAGMFWLNNPNVYILDKGENNDAVWCEGQHEGYKCTKHRRKVIFHKNDFEIEIIDTLFTNNTVEITFHLHFHPDMDVKIENGRIKIADFALIENELVSDGKLIKGDDVLPYGWYSERYDKKIASQSFLSKRTISCDTIIKTRVRICVEY